MGGVFIVVWNTATPDIFLVRFEEKQFSKSERGFQMSKIWYLSPSNQSGNVGFGAYGTEKEQMYLLTDAVAAHLDRCGVEYVVADPNSSIQQRCADANKMKVSFYLALHSNAGGAGKAWGPIAFYYSAGKNLAEKLAANLLAAGQKNNRAANVQQNKTLYELRIPEAPACLLETDFHDSEVGVDFLMNHRKEAAEAIAKAIVSVDGKTWVEPGRGDLETAVSLGLLDSGANGKDPLTKAEAAAAFLRLKSLLERACGA